MISIENKIYLKKYKELVVELEQAKKNFFYECYNDRVNEELRIDLQLNIKAIEAKIEFIKLELKQHNVEIEK